LAKDLPALPLGSFLETLAAGPFEPCLALVFFEAAADFTPFAAGFDFDVLGAGFVFATALLTGFDVFTDLVEDGFLVSVALDLDALLAPASRVAFFGAAGAFATWSFRRNAFPGITKTHVKSEKSV
jgi:hypothetical protein